MDSRRLDSQQLEQALVAVLYRLGPVSLRLLLRDVARHLRGVNAARIRAQQNADGSRYAPRRHGRRRMLLGYARRIRDRVGNDQAIIGIFGRRGKLGAVHDQGLVERGIRYPARNLLGLPDADKAAVLAMAGAYLQGAA